MSHNLTLAQNHAFDLARTLMVPVTPFQAENEFGVMVSSEYDGDQDAIVHEYDPGARLIEPGDRLPLAPCRLQGRLRRARRCGD